METPPETSLATISAFQQALAEATTIPEVKGLADKAALFKQWLSKQKAGREAINAGAEMMLRAERRLGGMLSDNIRHQGGRPNKNSNFLIPLRQLSILERKEFDYNLALGGL